MLGNIPMMLQDAQRCSEMLRDAHGILEDASR